MPSNIEIKAVLKDHAAAEALAIRLSGTGQEVVYQQDSFFGCEGAQLKHPAALMNRANLNFIGTVIVALLFFASLQSARGQETTVPPPSASGSTVHGVVRDAAMKPVSGAVISLQNEHEKLAASTDAAGTYRFAILMDGTYTLTVKKTGYVDLTVECAIGRNESKTVDWIVQSQGLPSAYNGSLPEFFDEPHFTVAGVSDTTNLGGHGS